MTFNPLIRKGGITQTVEDTDELSLFNVSSGGAGKQVVNAETVEAMLAGLQSGGVELEFYNVVYVGGAAAAPVVIGDQIPDALLGTTWQAGHLTSVQTTSAIYKVNADGTKSVVVPGTQSATGATTFNRIVSSLYTTSRFYKYVNGVRSPIGLLATKTTLEIIHKNNSLSTIIGTLDNLTTDNKSDFVGAINELNAVIAYLEVHNVLYSGPDAEDNVVIGMQIPGAPPGILWEAGQLVSHPSTGYVFSVNADGGKTMIAGTGNNRTTFNRIINWVYGTSTFFQFVDNTAQSIHVLSNNNTGSLYHNTISLSSTIGTLTTLATDHKDSLVGAINEIVTDVGYMQAYLEGRDGPTPP